MPIYYGHGGSWLVVLVLVGFAMRALAMRRRRGSAPNRTASSSFTGGYPGGGPTGAGTAPTPPGYTGVPPGWLKDPSGRHEQRYWSGTEWTEHVTDRGAPGIDPPPAAGR